MKTWFKRWLFVKQPPLKQCLKDLLRNKRGVYEELVEGTGLFFALSYLKDLRDSLLFDNGLLFDGNCKSLCSICGVMIITLYQPRGLSFYYTNNHKRCGSRISPSMSETSPLGGESGNLQDKTKDGTRPSSRNAFPSMDPVSWFLKIPPNPRGTRSDVRPPSLSLRSSGHPEDEPRHKPAAPARSVSWSMLVEVWQQDARSVTWSAQDEVFIIPARE